MCKSGIKTFSELQGQIGFYLPFLEIQNEELGRKRKIGSSGKRIMTMKRGSEGESQEPSCPAGLESNCPDGQDDRRRREQGLFKK